jgi:hypothetical protein
MPFPATNWFKKTLEDALENTIPLDLNSDEIKCALFTDAISGTFNFDANPGYLATPWMTTNEVSGAGYTTGGAVLTSPGVSIASNAVIFSAGNAVWTTSTITAHGCLVYDNTISPKHGLVAVNFGGQFESTAGTFTVAWNADGILRFA